MGKKVKVKATTYKRDGETIKRKAYTKEITPKARKAAKKSIKKAIKESKRISKKEHRRTIVKGRKVRAPEDEYMYLGRTVKDIPPKGYSHVKEVRDTLKRLELDFKKGAISEKTVNARTMRMKGIIENTKQGKLAKNSSKRSAIKSLNVLRRKFGFKPVSLRITPKRPTRAQKQVAKINIKKAQRKWKKMSTTARREARRKEPEALRYV